VQVLGRGKLVDTVVVSVVAAIAVLAAIALSVVDDSPGSRSMVLGQCLGFGGSMSMSSVVEISVVSVGVVDVSVVDVSVVGVSVVDVGVVDVGVVSVNVVGVRVSVSGYSVLVFIIGGLYKGGWSVPVATKCNRTM
jgi:hypothetical protein